MTPSADNSASANFVAEIEQEVLGALLVSGQFGAVIGLVKVEHFLEPLHRRIFENIMLAGERFQSSRMPLVYKLFPPAELTHWQTELKMPLADYLSALASNTVYGIGGIARAVKNLHAQWGRHQIIAESELLAVAAADPAADPVELVRAGTRALDDVSAGVKGGTRSKTRFSVGEAASAALDDVEAAMARGSGITGVTWGLSDINLLTGGVHAGEMVVIGARPGMGKTAFAGSVALKMAKAGRGVAFISLEMGAKNLAKRFISDCAYDWGVQVPYVDLITGRVQRQDFEALQSASADIERLPLWIEEQSGLTLSDLKVKVDRIRDQAVRVGQSLDVLIVDYLQLLHASGRYAGNRVQEVTELSSGLRNLGREEGFAVIALSQLSRGVESRPLHERRPMLSDLRESGSIEQDADTVAFLFREAYYLQNEKGKDPDAEAERFERLIDCQNKLEFIIAKQRNGPVKTVDLFVDIACSAVRNAARL